MNPLEIAHKNKKKRKKERKKKNPNSSESGISQDNLNLATLPGNSA